MAVWPSEPVSHHLFPDPADACPYHHDLSSSAAVFKVNSSTPLHLVSDHTSGQPSSLDGMTTGLDDPDLARGGGEPRA